MRFTRFTTLISLFLLFLTQGVAVSAEVTGLCQHIGFCGAEDGPQGFIYATEAPGYRPSSIISFAC